MDFELEDIKQALQVQVVAGMYFDRRGFLVANTGENSPSLSPSRLTKPDRSPPTLLLNPGRARCTIATAPSSVRSWCGQSRVPTRGSPETPYDTPEQS